jgi:glucose/mannose transport system substrate-binding protein
MKYRLAVLLICLSWVACGGQTRTGSGTVEIFSWWVAPGEREALEALIAVHSETHPDTTVVNAAATDAATARDRLRTRLTDGNPPDIFQTQAADLLGYVRVNGVDDSESLIEPLDFLRESEGWMAAFPPQALEALSDGGHLYAVPVNIHRVNSLFYNTHVLAEHGIATPTSIDELRAACETLESATPPVPCLAISAQAGWTLSLFLFESLLPAQSGVDFYESYFRGEQPADDPRILEAASTMLELMSYAHPDARSLSWDEAVELVGTGDAAFTVMGDWAKGYLRGRGLEPGVDFGQVAFPSSEPLFVYTADAFALARGAPNRDGAIELLRTAGSIEAQIAFNLIKGSIPARIDAPTDTFDVLGRSTAHDFLTSRVTTSLSATVSTRFTDPVNDALVDMIDRHDTTVLVTTLASYNDILQEAR